jgi:hypothetical protein
MRHPSTCCAVIARRSPDSSARTSLSRVQRDGHRERHRPRRSVLRWSITKLGGAAFDVFHDEPPADTDLLMLPNFVSTPHVGGSSIDAALAMGRAAFAGLEP